MKYQGRCHCGRVAFSVSGQISGALECNCSICHRKGSVLWFVPREQFELVTPEEAAASYTFNRHVIKHRFCKFCGIHAYGEGVDPKGNSIAAVNLRCIDGFELSSVPIQQYDGRSA